MDEYVVGSIAELIAGNLTPSRPNSLKRPQTPKKHQPSPHVTPRSEAISVREALLSPTLQRKKAVAKKSPKRIFEKEDLNETAEEIASPKAEKVKKHLQADLDSSKNTKSANAEMALEVCGTLIKKKTKRNHPDNENQMAHESIHVKHENASKGNVKKYQQNGKNINLEECLVSHEPVSKKKRNKNSKNKMSASKELMESNTDVGDVSNIEIKVSKNVKRKKEKYLMLPQVGNENDQEKFIQSGEDATALLKVKKKRKKNKKKQIKTMEPVDSGGKSDSEHESDNDIDSETEQDIKQILDSGPIEGDTSDEEAGMKQIKKKKNKKDNTESGESVKLSDEAILSNAEDDKKRTLFVGNVPLSKKTKKEIKQIFMKYGTIETVRIRAVPVKDMRMSPKVAAIKSEIHPDRTSVNVYVRFADEESVFKALVENNRVLSHHHLRVKRSDTAEAHDPRRALFVGNVPLGIEDEVLRAAFEKCGAIESVRVVRDKATRIGKGFAYVNFASSDGVELALGLSEEDLTIKNRILRIRRYTQAPPGQKVKTKPQLQKRVPSHGPGQNRGPNLSRGPPNRGPNSGPPNREYSNYRGQNNYDGSNAGNRGFGGPNKFNGRNNSFPGNRGHSFQRDGKPKDDSGAMRRINKRKTQDNLGPTEKRDPDQPVKEKKSKKEFVGMTAEKKKKKKFDKGRKQRQMLSEILTK